MFSTVQGETPRLPPECTTERGILQKRLGIAGAPPGGRPEEKRKNRRAWTGKKKKAPPPRRKIAPKQHHPPAIQRDRGITADVRCSMDDTFAFYKIYNQIVDPELRVLGTIPAVSSFLYKPVCALLKTLLRFLLHRLLIVSWFGTTDANEIVSLVCTFSMLHSAE